MNSTPNPGQMSNTSCTGNTTAQLEQNEYLKSLEVLEATKILPTIIILALIAIFGSIGNTITLIVYYKRFKPCSMRIYIITMSVLDLLCNILVIPSEILDMRFSMTFSYPGVCRAMKAYTFFIPTMSVFTLVQVALDRRRKILTSFAYKTFTKETKRSLMLWGVVAGIISVPNVIVYGQQSVTTDDPCVKGWACGMDDDYIQTSFPLVCIIFNGLVFLACFVVITASYVQIANKIAQHERQISNPKALPAGCASTFNSNERKFFETVKGPPKKTCANFYFRQVPRSKKARQPRGNLIASDSSDVIVSDELTTAEKSVLKDNSPPDVERCFRCEEADTGSPPNNCRNITMEIETKFLKLQKEPTENAHQTHSTQPMLPSLFDRVTSNSSSEPHNQTIPSDDSINSENISNTNINSVGHVSTNRENARDVTLTSAQTWRLSPKKVLNRTTRIMFIISVTLMVSFVPYYTIFVLREAHGQTLFGLNAWKLNMYNLAIRSYFINSLVNPLIYSLFSERFRFQCRQLFCHIFRGREALNVA